MARLRDRHSASADLFLRTIRAVATSFSEVKVKERIDPKPFGLDSVLPATPSEVKHRKQTVHGKAGTTEKREGLRGTPTTINDIVYHDDGLVRVDRALHQTTAAMLLSLLPDEPSTKLVFLSRSEHTTYQRIGSESVPHNLTGLSLPETTGEYFSHLREKLTVQHRNAGVQKPADGLSARIGDQFVLSPHQRTLVQLPPEFYELGPGGRSESAVFDGRHGIAPKSSVKKQNDHGVANATPTPEPAGEQARSSLRQSKIVQRKFVTQIVDFPLDRRVNVFILRVLQDPINHLGDPNELVSPEPPGRHRRGP